MKKALIALASLAVVIALIVGGAILILRADQRDYAHYGPGGPDCSYSGNFNNPLCVQMREERQQP